MYLSVVVDINANYAVDGKSGYHFPLRLSCRLIASSVQVDTEGGGRWWIPAFRTVRGVFLRKSFSVKQGMAVHCLFCQFADGMSTC